MKIVLLKFQFLLIIVTIADQSTLSLLSPVTNQTLEPPQNRVDDWHMGKDNYTRVYLNRHDYVAAYFLNSTLNQINFRGSASTTTSPVHDNTNWLSTIETSNWLFNFTSNAWSYMKQTYGEFGPNPYLNLVFHPECSFFNPYLEYSIATSQDLNLIHIPFPSLQSQSQKNLTQGDALDLLANTLAYFVERSSKQRFGTPSFQVWKLPGRGLHYTAWSDIFTFDLYTNLNLPSQAERYRVKVLNSVDIDLTSKVWFRHWFLPIYSGSKDSIDGKGNGNAVLNRYFEILSDNDPQIGVKYGRKYELNMGWFVHLWSAAVNVDLRELARNAFGWNDDYEKQFLSARQNFPYNYTDLFFTTTTEPNIAGPTLMESDDKKGTKIDLGVAAIAGTAIIISLILALIASFIFYKNKILYLQSEIRTLTKEEVKDFFDGEFVSGDQNNQDLPESMPFVKDFEIEKDQIIFDQPSKIIGSGQFGCVMRGRLRNKENNELMPVAVKTVKADVKVLYFKAMLSEAKIMAYLGRHNHIVGLVGTYTANIKNREIFIALELCPLGDLHKFLKRNQSNFKDLFANLESLSSGNGKRLKTEVIEETYYGDECSGLITATTLDLLKWSVDISEGMMYLTLKKVIHGDLAARNVLLTRVGSERVAQISDFGLSRQLLNYAIYKKSLDSETPLPWRWMAVESLNDMKFSIKSDVWSFGVTLWEMFSLAQMPYAGGTWDSGFVDRLIRGDRLPSPQYANQDLFELMQDCWKIAPTERPSFSQINQILKEVISPLPVVWECNVNLNHGRDCMEDGGECLNC